MFFEKSSSGLIFFGTTNPLIKNFSRTFATVSDANKFPKFPQALQLLRLLPAKVTGATGFSTAPIEAGLHLQFIRNFQPT